MEIIFDKNDLRKPTVLLEHLSTLGTDDFKEEFQPAIGMADKVSLSLGTVTVVLKNNHGHTFKQEAHSGHRILTLF